MNRPNKGLFILQAFYNIFIIDTGKGKHSTEISLRHFSLTKYFSIIETGSPSGPRKVQGIESVLHQWSDIHKSEVVYIGDAPSDITACRQVGIPVVAAAWADSAEPKILQAMRPDALFLNIEDFRIWLYIARCT
ncbi:HAD family hydrolase [Pedobacter sp. AW31-3R]|uniref:HAD family hydrolase n=1 Tax=Pedobacter sp. AW31-3R TaxID=3445781 RepID=UPI003F9F6F26